MLHGSRPTTTKSAFSDTNDGWHATTMQQRLLPGSTTLTDDPVGSHGNYRLTDMRLQREQMLAPTSKNTTTRRVTRSRSSAGRRCSTARTRTRSRRSVVDVEHGAVGVPATIKATVIRHGADGASRVSVYVRAVRHLRRTATPQLPSDTVGTGGLLYKRDRRPFRVATGTSKDANTTNTERQGDDEQRPPCTGWCSTSRATTELLRPRQQLRREHRCDSTNDTYGRTNVP